MTDQFAQDPVDVWALDIEVDDNPGLAQAGSVQVDAAGDVVLDPLGNPVTDVSPAGRPIFDEAEIGRIKDIWLVFNYRYELPGEAGDPVVFWTHVSSLPDAAPPHQGRQVAGVPPAVVNVSWVSDQLAGAASWTIASGRFVQTTNGAQAIYRPSAQVVGNDHSIEAYVYPPSAVGDVVGLVVRYADPAQASHPACYAVTLTAKANTRFDMALERRGIAPQRFNLPTDLALSTSLAYSLRLVAFGQRLEVWLDEAVLFSVVDANAQALAAGTIGLYAAGSAQFGDVWVSDMTNRR